jgi:hypothetical protein
MKTKLIITAILACATLAAVSGCKKEEPAPAAPKADQGTASQAAPVVDAAKSAVNDVTNQAAAQATAAPEQAQGLIDRAKSLVADSKYTEALSSLNQLTTTKLTDDQQKLVDGLKAQIQAALAKATGSDAASALGGALGGKK